MKIIEELDKKFTRYAPHNVLVIYASSEFMPKIDRVVWFDSSEGVASTHMNEYMIGFPFNSLSASGTYRKIHFIFSHNLADALGMDSEQLTEEESNIMYLVDETFNSNRAIEALEISR